MAAKYRLSLGPAYFGLCFVSLFVLNFYFPYFESFPFNVVIPKSLIRTASQLTRHGRKYPSFNKTIRDASTDRRSDFVDHWFKLHKARVDWQAMLAPCRGNTDWGITKPGWGKGNRTSGRESYVHYRDVRPAGEFSRIFIHTRTADGRDKTIGGDSWRVYLNGPSNVYATVFDHENGTYEAMALIIEPGEYVVEAILDYSLCDGLKDPPEYWFKVGNAQGKYQPSGMLGFLDEYLVERFQEDKNITIQVSPSGNITSRVRDFLNIGCHETCGSLWHGYGRWIENSWVPYITENRNRRQTRVLSRKRKGTLWIYGDSLALRLHYSLSTKLLCNDVFLSCQYSYNWIYPLPGKREHEGKTQNDDLDFRPHLVLESIRDVLRSDGMQSNDSLLVLNLGLHFPIGINFMTYQKLIGDVIGMLKHREQELGSKAKVIWKTSTAIHKENVEKPRNLTNWRFFTDQRVRLFDAFAMSAMCKAGIEILDVYHLTASYPRGTTDVVHYEDGVFRKAEMEIERYTRSGFSDKPRQVCLG